MARRIAELRGLHGPESARYDPQLDVYYISNMTGYGSSKDGNGFIVRVAADDFTKASVLAAGGNNGVVLHAPKGLAIHGDTLWAADIDVLRGFNRRTGAPIANVDLSGQGAVLLNDIAIGGDGNIYVTDSGIRMTDKGVVHPGGDKIFAVGPEGVSIVARGNVLGRPNGITWDARNRRLIVASFDPFHSEVYAITPGDSRRTVLARGNGKFDGVEVLGDGRLLVASWSDSSVHSIRGSENFRMAVDVWQPADFGVDTRRNRIAIPSSVMDRVELWEMPRETQH
jgi:sugar lactone lactonase YvrE